MFTLTVAINGEQEVHFFKRRNAVTSFVESVTSELECEGLSVTDETWVACVDEGCFEVKLTVESEDDDDECLSE